MQGAYAVPEVIDALRRLDRDPEVDVIVLTRGGGSVEDLLPFSEESLVRAVAACRTPVVSAIGHEQDTRCSTSWPTSGRPPPPTPPAGWSPTSPRSWTASRTGRKRARAAVAALVEREQHRLDTARGRPVLADPFVLVEGRGEAVEELLARAARSFAHRLDRATDEVGHLRARVVSLSPAATLERGYAVVQLSDGPVVRDPEDVPTGAALRVRVAAGELRGDEDGVPSALPIG